MRYVQQHVPIERNLCRVNAVLGLAEAVEAGIGIGHLPCFVADARPDLIRLAPPEPEFAADLWLLTHRDLRRSARARALLDFLATEIAKKKSFIEGAKPPGGRPSSSPKA
jgi:DNA-binding transcriptional LysR family regulator